MVANKGLSRRNREIAQEKYVLPALRTGVSSFSLRVRDLMEDLRKEGFSPEHNTPQFCSAIRRADFLEENGLEITGIEGPPSKQSTTVVVNYRVLPREGGATVESTPQSPTETPKERAHRLTGKLFGLMKDEIAAHGGAEGYMRWVRSDDDQDAR